MSSRRVGPSARLVSFKTLAAAVWLATGAAAAPARREPSGALLYPAAPAEMLDSCEAEMEYEPDLT